MNHLPANPLIARGLEIAERELGIVELSVRLGSPVSSIEAWKLGHASMPQSKFLMLVELLTRIDPHWTNDPDP